MKNKLLVYAAIVIFFAFIGGAGILYKNLISKTDLGEMELKSSSEQDGDKDTENQQNNKKKAPDFSVMDTNGNTVKLSELLGKPVVLNFWASWCPPCKSEMSEFDEVFGELGEEVNFMMINMTDGNRETKEKAKDYIADQGYKFPVYFDTSQDAAYLYGISSIPTTMFISADGYLVTGAKGTIKKEVLKKGIEMAKNYGLVLSEIKYEKVANSEWYDIQPEYTKITVDEAKTIMLKDNEFYDTVILDVRSQKEYDEGHIKDAVLLPDNEIKEKIESIITDKKTVVLVYCRSGNRSANAVKEMVKMGYNHVYDFGGIIDWDEELEK